MSNTLYMDCRNVEDGSFGNHDYKCSYQIGWTVLVINGRLAHGGLHRQAKISPIARGSNPRSRASKHKFRPFGHGRWPY